MVRSIVEAVFGYAAQQPDKLCIADDAEKVTYRAFADRILMRAGYFKSIGIGRGDKAVVEAAQTAEFLSLEMALHLLGAVFVPVERNCAHEKIREFAKRCDAKLVVTANAFVFDDVAHVTAAEIVEAQAEPLVPEGLTFPETDTESEYLFSTGTTGREKGIIITHKNDIALAGNVIYGVEMEKDNVEMILSPMNHSHGLRRWYANMANGSSIVLLGSAMNVARFFKNLDEYHVNSVDMVPSALSVVLKLSRGKLMSYAAQIRYIQFGAAPMAEADRLEICRQLPDTRLYNFYGSTESGCISIYNFNRPDSKKSCVGKPTHNARIFMVDDDRHEIVSSRENTGLLASFGPMNTPGYLNDPEETAKALENGVIYSNDIAYLDEDGDIILMGRKGDVINIGGHKVSPDEIENAVMKMPEIADAGVIPIPDRYKGNVPKLFVQMKAGKTFDPVRIREFLAESLEPYKVPSVIVEIAKMPRSFNGKLLRRELK